MSSVMSSMEDSLIDVPIEGFQRRARGVDGQRRDVDAHAIKLAGPPRLQAFVPPRSDAEADEFKRRPSSVTSHTT